MRLVILMVALASALSGVPFAGLALAGAVIEVKTDSFVDAAKSGAAVVYLVENKLRIDSTEGGSDVSVIYSIEVKEQPRFYMIDRKQKSYYELTKSDMDMMKAKIDEAKRTFETQLQYLPPEERRRMEKLYEEQMGPLGKEAEPPTYKKVASGTKVGSWACTHYEGYREGVKREEVWAAPLGDLGLKESDLRMFGELAALLENAGQDMPAFFQFALATANDRGLQGFPVIVVEYDDGKRREKSQVTAVRQENLDPGFFRVPEGLVKKEIAR